MKITKGSLGFIFLTFLLFAAGCLEIRGPVPPPPPTLISATPATSLMQGSSHTCALTPDLSALKCWGNNSDGQLGYGDEVERGQNAGDVAALIPVPVPDAYPVVSVCGGGRYTCGLTADMNVYCWGKDIAGTNQGVLGQGNMLDYGNTPTPPLPQVPIGGNAIAISCGTEHVCALMQTGTVRCWGDNNVGQLGIGTTATQPHLGDNTTTDSMTLIQDIPLGGTVTQIAAGQDHTCALLSSGVVKCWGYNNYGELGIDSNTNVGVNPGEVASLVGVNLGGSAISIGVGDYHSCAILSNGTLKCWGYNNHGQLGQNDSTNRSDSPGHSITAVAAINLGNTATQVIGGTQHTCALLAGGSEKCWGLNASGELGQDAGAADIGDTPGSMAALSSIAFSTSDAVVALATGPNANGNCAWFSNSGVMCWGDNCVGELGTGGNNNCATDVGLNPGDMASLSFLPL